MGFVKTHDISEITSDLIGKEVVLGGWIEDLRKLGKMTFITLRDRITSYNVCYTKLLRSNWQYRMRMENQDWPGGKISRERQF